VLLDHRATPTVPPSADHAVSSERNAIPVNLEEPVFLLVHVSLEQGAQDRDRGVRADGGTRLQGLLPALRQGAHQLLPHDGGDVAVDASHAAQFVPEPFVGENFGRP